MTLEQFTALLDHFGGDAASWPLAQRAPAKALCAECPAAAALWRDAQRLDALLDAEAAGLSAQIAAPVSAALTARLLADAQRETRGATLDGAALWRAASRRAQVWFASAMTGAAAAGLAVGLLTAPPAPTTPFAEEDTLLALSHTVETPPLQWSLFNDDAS